ncbi:MAG: RluA family pseudouridine synthase [Puniceicoccales bacterium]|jgi:23S rRNA-/tRNA-specific pseudouridylate synthase|nr:RluA family pseudouridine synthase [Puniceicoccales bacterium]
MNNIPLGVGVRLLARHPSGLLAFEKPAGVATHPNRSGSRSSSETLVDASYDLKQELYQLDDGSRLFLLNRIDSPTSGIVLAATDPVLATQIKELFRRGRVSKTYFAIVKGARLPIPDGSWRDRLDKRHNDAQIRVHIGRGGIPSVTRYKWLASVAAPAPLSLLRLTPETGRTHQLRVQCAAHARPIAGDKTYGDFAFNRVLEKGSRVRRLLLHAAAVTFTFFHNGRSETFTAQSPLPAEFLKLFPDAAAHFTTPTLNTTTTSSCE